jgi:hypothetical protein
MLCSCVFATTYRRWPPDVSWGHLRPFQVMKYTLQHYSRQTSVIAVQWLTDKFEFRYMWVLVSRYPFKFAKIPKHQPTCLTVINLVDDIKK